LAVTTTQERQQTEPRHSIPECGQKVSGSGRILVSRKAWAARVAITASVVLVVAYTLQQGIELGDAFVVYSTLMPVHTLLILVAGWFFYKSNLKGKLGDELVSVIIPIYNQESIIGTVIEAAYNSSYHNIEVIAVNDGSKDGTRQVLDELRYRFPTLKVIHKENGGKRRAVATGFFESKGDYIVMIDSDSVIKRGAIEEFMKVFKADPNVGAAVGNVKALNHRASFLTKCQDAWYDFSFNAQKACESFFGNVLCCSGALSAYRREAIQGFVAYWAEAKLQMSDDRQLTSYVLAPPTTKSSLRQAFGDRQPLSPLSERLMESVARYDDSEDRGLTAHTLVNWKSVYVASAISHTEVPEKWGAFMKQQMRWKKGTLRTNFFVSAFFWRKNPIIALYFYLEFMMTFMAPLIIFVVYFYEPFVLGMFWLPLIFLSGKLLIGLGWGLDYKLRDQNTRNWMYKPVMDLIVSFLLPWLLFPAVWTYKKNKWLTR
jgi:hyaluronan synthase